MTFTTTMKLGVLDDAGLLMYSYRQKAYSFISGPGTNQIDNLDDLLRLANTYELQTIWVTPGSLCSHNARDIMVQSELLDLKQYGSAKKDGTPRFTMAWRPGGLSLKIGWPEHDSRWPWQRCTDARTLLKTILYEQDAIEAEIVWSPGHVGQNLMLELNENHPQWLMPSAIPDVVKQEMALDMQWKKPIAGDKKRPLWFHLFDKSSAYCAACTSANLGEGSPQRVLASHVGGNLFRGHTAWNLKAPGIWRIDDKWLWTPQIDYLLAENPDWVPCIPEGYVWPEKRYHTTLRGWGVHMWDARYKLNPEYIETNYVDPDARQLAYYVDPDARQLAYKAAKTIANQGLGWLAMESKRGDNKLYRPDWWSMVVATAYRNMGFKIRQLNAQGLPPIYCNVDALGLISDSPSLDRYQYHLLQRMGHLGGFKHEKTVRLTPARAEMFDENVSFRDCQNAVVSWEEES